MKLNAIIRLSWPLLAALFCFPLVSSTARIAAPASNTCEPVANYNGPSADPLWSLVCIKPCTQGCEHTYPVEIYPEFFATTCVCYGGAVDPERTCCRLFLVDGPEGYSQPTGIGDCGTSSCDPGDYCEIFWYDVETVGAECKFD